MKNSDDNKLILISMEVGFGYTSLLFTLIQSYIYLNQT